MTAPTTRRGRKSPATATPDAAPSEGRTFLAAEVYGMSVDPRAQRVLNERNIRRLARDGGFDPVKLGALIVSERGDGTYALMDGQHRRHWAETEGYAGEFHAVVHQGLTVQQEADAFLGFNGSQAVPQVDRFLAQVTRGDERAVKIRDLLAENGWEVRSSNATASIVAVGAIGRIVENGVGEYSDKGRLRYPLLDATIKTITAAWGYKASGVHQNILTGLARFLARFDTRVNRPHLVARLRETSPEELLAEANRQRKALNQGGVGTVTASDATALVIANKFYGQRLTKAKKLVWTTGS